MVPDGLLRIARGEVLADEWSRKVYSVDASDYEIEPAAVAFPKDGCDLQEICRYASAKHIPITARGAGTGLLGQSLSDGGLVLNFTRHMNRVLETGDDYVIVEPGMVKGMLDRELKKRGKFLPPDPASSNYCTVGGMIAGNSSGVHCLGYGNTIDFIEGVDFVYADGNIGRSSESDGRLSKLKNLLGSTAGLILSSYPKVRKNSCGYRLDAVLKDGFLPHKIFAASEGTLGLVTSARLRIMDLPEHRCLMVLGFESLLAAVSAVPSVLEFSPVALEMLDSTVLAHSDYNAGAGCLLFVEFAGQSRIASENRIEKCRSVLAGRASVVEYAADEQSLAHIWGARKGALNDIMKMTVGSRKPIGLIEDTVVPPEMLEQHTANLLRAYRDNKLEYVMYGHMGDGNMHTRPLVDTGSKSESEMMRRLAAEIFAQVIRSGGTITGEHGDGLARVGYIEAMYGNAMTSLFRQVKDLFDPGYLLNPGKKVLV